MQLKHGAALPKSSQEDKNQLLPPVYCREPSPSRRDLTATVGTGAEYHLATVRPFFVKDNEAVSPYGFFQMLRCTRGQMDYQRWLVKSVIARSKAIEAWLDVLPRRDLLRAMQT